MVPQFDRCAWTIAASDNGIVPSESREVSYNTTLTVMLEAPTIALETANHLPMGRVHIQPRPSIDNLGG